MLWKGEESARLQAPGPAHSSGLWWIKSFPTGWWEARMSMSYVVADGRSQCLPARVKWARGGGYDVFFSFEMGCHELFLLGLAETVILLISSTWRWIGHQHDLTLRFIYM
jgi:hypothetical protein